MLTKALKAPFTINDIVDIQNYEKRTFKVLCPSCNKNLIAKQGEIISWHFAHENNDECEFAYESELHLIAKECLQKGDLLKLPILIGKKIKVLQDPEEVMIDDILIEKKLSNIKPDLIVVSKGKRLLLEIAVTHFIDEEKKRKIQKLGISCIEVNLSKFTNKIIDKNKLREIILSKKTNKKWVFHRKAEHIERKKLEYKKEKEIQEEKEREKRDQRIKEEIISNLEIPALRKIEIISRYEKKGFYYAEFEAELGMFFKFRKVTFLCSWCNDSVPSLDVPYFDICSLDFVDNEKDTVDFIVNYYNYPSTSWISIGSCDIDMEDKKFERLRKVLISKI